MSICALHPPVKGSYCFSAFFYLKLVYNEEFPYKIKFIIQIQLVIVQSNEGKHILHTRSYQCL